MSPGKLGLTKSGPPPSRASRSPAHLLVKVPQPKAEKNSGTAWVAPWDSGSYLGPGAMTKGVEGLQPQFPSAQRCFRLSSRL